MEFIRWVGNVALVMLTVLGAVFLIGGFAAGSFTMLVAGGVMAACGYGMISRRM